GFGGGLGLGGALDNEHGGAVTVRNSTFTDNQALGGFRTSGSDVLDGLGAGGAIENGAIAEFLAPSLILADSNLIGNVAKGANGDIGVDGGSTGGGGLSNAFGATAQLIHSNFTDNLCLGGNGGNGGSGGEALGGGLVNNFGGAMVTVTNSEFNGNQA